MITLNLLPDIKKEYLKSRRTKSTILSLGILASLISIGIVVALFLYINVGQNIFLSTVQRNIDSNIEELKAIEDLDKLVTVQNQLETLPGLHNQKPAADRLFSYLDAVLPSTVNISELDVSLDSAITNPTITITGGADAVGDVNIFVDTLKNARYVTGEDNQLAFTNVVLVSITPSEVSEKISYEVEFGFDPIIFDNTIDDIALEIPNIISTRSEVERPQPVFQQSSEEVE